MLAPVLGALAVLTAALTVWFVRTRPATDEDPDARFWYIFTGASVLAPVVLGAAAHGQRIGVAVLAAVIGTVLTTDRFSVATLRRRLASGDRRLLVAKHQALAERHEAVLMAWARYELDPGAAIDHPGMNDVQLPATSALAKAFAAAENLRDPAISLTGAAEAERYRQAVIRLESAFRQAELAGTGDSAAHTAWSRATSPNVTGSAAASAPSWGLP